MLVQIQVKRLRLRIDSLDSFHRRGRLRPSRRAQRGGD
jgi:hypothetical protein